MNKEDSEKRSCIRLPVKGATLQYKKGKTCQVVNISRGGINFLSQESLAPNSPIAITLTIPREASPLNLKGQVCWCLPALGRSDEYQIGARFLPFENKRGLNDPRLLGRLLKLENEK